MCDSRISDLKALDLRVTCQQRERHDQLIHATATAARMYTPVRSLPQRRLGWHGLRLVSTCAPAILCSFQRVGVHLLVGCICGLVSRLVGSVSSILLWCYTDLGRSGTIAVDQSSAIIGMLRQYSGRSASRFTDRAANDVSLLGQSRQKQCVKHLGSDSGVSPPPWPTFAMFLC